MSNKKKNAAGDIVFLALFVILGVYLYGLAGK